MKRREFAERVKDIRAANLMALIANVNRSKKKKPTPYTARDFLPRGRPQTWQEQKKIMQAITAGIN